MNANRGAINSCGCSKLVCCGVGYQLPQRSALHRRQVVLIRTVIGCVIEKSIVLVIRFARQPLEHRKAAAVCRARRVNAYGPKPDGSRSR